MEEGQGKSSLAAALGAKRPAGLRILMARQPTIGPKQPARCAGSFTGQKPVRKSPLSRRHSDRLLAVRRKCGTEAKYSGRKRER